MLTHARVNQFIWYPSHFLLKGHGFFYLFLSFFVEDPPIEYWRILAEQRRVALVEALNENEEVGLLSL